MNKPAHPVSEYSTTELLRAYGIDPKKSLGQNFIINNSILKDIVRLANVTSDDLVLEIGAGVGNLTQYLAKTAKKVIAVEIDHRFVPILEDLSREYRNLTVVFEDVMDLDINSIIDDQRYIVVGNIPYNITSALIRKLVSSKSQPSRIVLTIQKEVAERITETAGQHSLLSLSVQLYGEPTILKTIKAGSFYPKPNVDSAVLLIDLFDSPVIDETQIDKFFMLSKAGFSQKRKTLANSLSTATHHSKDEISAVLEQIGLKPMIRPQELTLSDWKALISML